MTSDNTTKSTASPLFSVSLNTPFGHTVLWGAALLFGIIGSLASKELIDLTNYTFTTITNSLLVYTYWTLGLFLIYLFRQQRIGESNSKSQLIRQMEHHLLTIKQMEATLPPDKFLHYFSELFHPTKKRFEKYRAIEKTLKQHTDLYSDIRHTLHVIAQLAKVFDEEEDETHYSCNLMLFRNWSDLTSKDIDILCNYRVMQFWEQKLIKQNNYEGVLFLDRMLTADTTTPGKGSIDTSIQNNIALPVRKINEKCDRQDENPKDLLFGAPRACACGAPTVVHDVSKLISTLETQTSSERTISIATSDAICDFFKTGDGKLIESIVSLPIFDSIEHNRCVGIVNIHKHKSGILRTQYANPYSFDDFRSAEIFWLVIRPYLSILSPFVTKLSTEYEIYR